MKKNSLSKEHKRAHAILSRTGFTNQLTVAAVAWSNAKWSFKSQLTGRKKEGRKIFGRGMRNAPSLVLVYCLPPPRRWRRETTRTEREQQERVVAPPLRMTFSGGTRLTAGGTLSAGGEGLKTRFCSPATCQRDETPVENAVDTHTHIPLISGILVKWSYALR